MLVVQRAAVLAAKVKNEVANSKPVSQVLDRMSCTKKNRNWLCTSVVKKVNLHPTEMLYATL